MKLISGGGRKPGRKEGGRCTGEGGAGVEGWEAGLVPKVAKSGRSGEKYATLHNISQSKKRRKVGVNKRRAGTGIKGYGKREVLTSPPPFLITFAPRP